MQLNSSQVKATHFWEEKVLNLNPFRATDAFMRRWLIVHQRRRRIYAFRVYNISYVDRFTQKLQYFIEHDIFDYNFFNKSKKIIYI